MQAGLVVDDRYELVAPAGAGGMSRVFRARDRASGAAVAVKVLVGTTPTCRDRFAREVDVVAALAHPGIVRYVGHGLTAAGAPYLAMEWLDGELVRRLIRAPAAAMAIDDALALGITVAEAIACAHGHGIVHGDLKPDNLLVVEGRTDRVKVLDFGIAHRRGEPGAELVLGTPGYMAPEQMRLGSAVDARADVFALGCVLFECLTGRRPFMGDDAAAVLARVLDEPTPRLRELRGDAPEPLDALLAAMLARQPETRPAHGGAVSRELRSIRREWERLAEGSSSSWPAVAAARPRGLTGSERPVPPVSLDGGLRPSGAREVLGRPTPCVGRDDELAALAAAWATCRDGSGSQVVVVTGAPGLGKSRLADELVRRLRAADEDARVWTARVDALHAGASLGLLAQALRGALDIGAGEAVPRRRERLRAHLAARVAPDAQESLGEFLGELIGAPAPGPESEPLRTARQEPRVMAEQLQRAWIDAVRAEAEAGPLLLVLDDLQWGDVATVRFIDAALRELGDARWMVLALARPEVDALFPALWEGRAQRLALAPLDAAASRRLARHVLGEVADDTTIARVVAQADGNPLFLEEILRAGPTGAEVPASVLAMVQHRLQALAPELRRTLRAASIFGDVCWASGVRALLAEPARDVEAALAELVRREVLVERSAGRFADEQELAFRHPLILQAAYAMVTDDDRVIGHGLAGDWLEARGEEDPLVLAAHFERGRQAGRAGRHYLAAALSAQRTADVAATIERAEAGLACPVTDDERLVLHVILTDAHGWVQAVPAALHHGMETLRRASPSSAERFIAYGTLLFFLPPDEFAAHLEKVLVATPGPGAVSAYACCLASSLHRLHRIGAFEQAARAERRLQAVVAVAPHNLLARGFYHVGQASREPWAREDPWKGWQMACRAVEELTEAGHPQMVQAALLGVGQCAWYLGDLDGAARTLGQLVREGLPVIRSLASEHLAGVLIDLGRLDEATAIAQGIVAGAPTRSFQGIGRALLADVHRGRGALDDAAREAEAAIAMLAELPLHRQVATATLAAVRLAQGQVAEARALAAEAMATCTELGAFGFRGTRTCLVHAEALWAAGEHAAARAAIAAAAARLTAVVGRIGDAWRRASYRTRIPEHARIDALARAWNPEISQSTSTRSSS